jgi:hypothetical protein
MHKNWTILERLSRDKHSSLFDILVSCKEKCFIILGPGANILRIYIFLYYMNVINKLEGLSLASLSNPLVRLLSTQVKITLRYDLGYMHKKWTILERLSRNKHSSLFDLFVSS